MAQRFAPSAALSVHEDHPVIPRAINTPGRRGTDRCLVRHVIEFNAPTHRRVIRKCVGLQSGEGADGQRATHWCEASNHFPVLVIELTDRVHVGVASEPCEAQPSDIPPVVAGRSALITLKRGTQPDPVATQLHDLHVVLGRRSSRLERATADLAGDVLSRPRRNGRGDERKCPKDPDLASVRHPHATPPPQWPAEGFARHRLDGARAGVAGTGVSARCRADACVGGSLRAPR